MKIRRSTRSVDLRNFPLDGFDMFLLSRVENQMTLAQLADIAPCDPEQTKRRVEQLARHGLVDLIREPHDAPAAAPIDLDPPVQSQSIELDEAITIRPPAKLSDDAVTLRPPMPLPIEELFRTSDPPSTVHTVLEAARGQVEFYTPEGVATTAGGTREASNGFLKTTLVDDDADERNAMAIFEDVS